MYTSIVVFSFIVLAIIGVFILAASRPSESQKAKVEKIYNDEHRKRLEYERRRNELIDHYTSFTCDLVPYDDPDYSVKVIKMAEELADKDLKLAEVMEKQKEMFNQLEEVKQSELETKELPF